TYAELNRRANRVARHLESRGVGVGSRVGVCIPRSLDLLVGLLGILKAGGAFVPLDPSHPDQRLAFLIADSKVSLVLTQHSLSARLSPAVSDMCRLDSDWPSIADRSPDDVASAVTLDDLAYVLYTSGSTGAPKGVMVPHRGLVNYLAWCVPAYVANDGAGAPLHTSIRFDLPLTALSS